jgi:hypothetical protein
VPFSALSIRIALNVPNAVSPRLVSSLRPA